MHNASDKLKTAISKNTPRHSNSLMRTKYSLRPGAMNPGGIGVDAKHNSYARYLAKKKGGRALRAEQQTDNTSVKKHNIVMGYYINNSNAVMSKKQIILIMLRARFKLSTMQILYSIIQYYTLL